MMSSNLNQIRQRTEKFRTALEQSDLSKWPTLANFPRGSCGDASLLLEKYLRDAGFDDFHYVYGEICEAGQRHTHAWLQREQLIVDITADQFGDVNSKVVVTDEHSWHDRYHPQTKEAAGWETFDEHTQSSLDAAYETVRSTMDDIEQKSSDGERQGD